MSEEITLNSHYIQLRGKAELPEKKKKGYNYPLICEVCNGRFLVTKTLSHGKRKQRFCSSACFGRHRMEIYKDKTNHPRWKKEGRGCLLCGGEKKFPYRKYCGRKCACIVNSKRARGSKRPALQGENNPNWKGGVSGRHESIRKSYKYGEWRKCVYENWGWGCAWCGERATSSNIVAHHIMLFSKFPEQRFNPQNGITMCRSCHLILHQIARKP